MPLFKDLLDDTPINDELTRAVTSNWAHDHETDPYAHSPYPIVKLDTSYTVTGSENEGELFWNSAKQTASLALHNGIVLDLGEELYYTEDTFNNTGTLIPNGTPVMVQSRTDTITYITPAIADGSLAPIIYLGFLTEETPNNSYGRVAYFGAINDIDTTALAETGITISTGDLLYVSPTEAGKLTNIEPESPYNIMIVGMCLKAGTTDGKIFIRHQYVPDAIEIGYNNIDSGLIASNVQSAIDELNLIKASVDLLSSNISLYATNVADPVTGYYYMVSSTEDPDYVSPAADISTGPIVGSDVLIGQFISKDVGLFVGNPGVISVTTFGYAARTAGGSKRYAEFYFEFYKRDNLGTETLIFTSNTTGEVILDTYQLISAYGVLNDGIWEATDYIVVKWYANDIGTAAPPSEYDIQLGGDNPTRTLIPVPVSVIPSDDASMILVDTTNFINILGPDDDTVQKALETIDADAQPRDIDDLDGYFSIDTVEDALAQLGFEDIIDANTISAGRLFGGNISDNGDGTISIAAGAGIIKLGGSSIDGDTGIPTAINEGQGSLHEIVTWDTVASFPMVGVGYNIIFWDASAAGFAAVLKDNFYDGTFNFVTDFSVGRVYYDGTNILARLCGMNRWNFERRVQMFGEERFPVERGTGLIISATGTRNIAMSAGVIWAELVNRFSIDGLDTSVSDTFTYWYRDGLGGWVEVPGQTQINNLLYDDGSGTLATLANSKYGIHWVYINHIGQLHVIYGQGSYNAGDIDLASAPGTIPGMLAAYATIIGKISIQKNASVFYTIQTAFEVTFGSSSVANHNDLSGLQGGTTDQYYHLAATNYNDIINGNFVRSDVDDSVTGVLTFASASDYPITINGSSDAKILLTGSSQPYIRFQEVSVDKSYILWHSDGYLSIANQVDDTIVRIWDSLDFSPDNGVNYYALFHEGNSNLNTVDWTTQNLYVNGILEVNAISGFNSETETLATLTQTEIASFPVATYGSGKFIIQANDTVSGEYHTTELLVVCDGTNVIATEYGTLFTGTDPLASYDVDIDTGNVRILATGASVNSTVYKITETLITI